MKNIITIMAIMIWLVMSNLIIACGHNEALIQSNMVSTNKGIFKEMESSAEPSEMEKYANLRIELNFKLYDRGKSMIPTQYMANERKADVLLSIDGQSIVWTISGNEEKELEHTFSRKRYRTEYAKGLRFNVIKYLIIKPGKHEIFLSLPEYNIYDSEQIEILTDKKYVIKAKPIYNKNSIGLTQFYMGIRAIDLSVDEKFI